MAEKISKIAIKVDLSCHCCYKKIQKVLCKMQVREKIQSISYDEKKNTVTISGPFDPQKLIQKLRCKACKVILDIQVIKDPPPPPPPKKKEIEPCEVINNIKIKVDLPEDPKCPESNPDSNRPCHPPVRPVCCRMPCYVAHHGGSRCCSCGMVYGCVVDCPQMMDCGGPSHGGYNICKLAYEEYPSASCTTM